MDSIFEEHRKTIDKVREILNEYNIKSTFVQQFPVRFLRTNGFLLHDLTACIQTDRSPDVATLF